MVSKLCSQENCSIFKDLGRIKKKNPCFVLTIEQIYICMQTTYRLWGILNKYIQILATWGLQFRWREKIRLLLLVAIWKMTTKLFPLLSFCFYLLRHLHLDIPQVSQTSCYLKVNFVSYLTYLLCRLLFLLLILRITYRSESIS